MAAVQPGALAPGPDVTNINKIPCCCPEAFDSANYEVKIYVIGFSVNFQSKPSGLLQE
jgi:hypothetical protein